MLHLSSSDQHPHKKSKIFFPKIIHNLNPLFFFRCSLLFLILLFQVLILHLFFPSQLTTPSPLLQDKHFPIQLTTPSPSPLLQDKQPQISQHPLPRPNHCKHGMVYVYDLPSTFNQDFIDNCRDLDPWHSRCDAISNNGLGRRVSGLSAVPESLAPAWYWTDMFAGEVLYHARILKHRCRTTEPESATAFYIPFYAGLAVGRFLFANNYTAQERDMHCERLLRWVHDQPPWRRSNGSDHFIMIGRMTWDFRRLRDGDWGSSFFYMPLMEKVLRLGVERDPWDQMEISVPYPTGFHPRSRQEMDQWLKFVANRNRTSLFTFVGGKRKLKGDFRTILLSHCANESDSCRVVDCSGHRCHNGSSKILDAFLASDFCLQPRGDALTRKSTFDCMLAGSIPVFFWRRSIERQYEWFLGDEPERFSVFVNRDGVRNGTTSIRKVLEGFSREEVERMREKVISLIPKFVYSHIGHDDEDGGGDAFHIAIDGVLKRFQVQNGKNNIIQ